MRFPLAMRHWRENWLASLQEVIEDRSSDGEDEIDAG